jgi:hypothetical protein
MVRHASWRSIPAATFTWPRSVPQPPRAWGVLDLPVVQGFSAAGALGAADGGKWDGNGRKLLYHCDDTMSTPPPWGASDGHFSAHEERVAEYEKLAAEADRFLASGLAAALSSSNR